MSTASYWLIPLTCVIGRQLLFFLGRAGHPDRSLQYREHKVDNLAESGRGDKTTSSSPPRLEENKWKENKWKSPVYLNLLYFPLIWLLWLSGLCKLCTQLCCRDSVTHLKQPIYYSFTNKHGFYINHLMIVSEVWPKLNTESNRLERPLWLTAQGSMCGVQS